jgi:anion-transporting  ArsA/GET3 family ATPase
VTALDVDALLDDPRTAIVVCCGSGGVGKTTTSAALALRAAERGRRAVVLTIDPAKRLAQALGLEALGNEPGRVPGAGAHGGELHAMMLDMRRTFDEMEQTHSTPERAEVILANPFYQTISSSFSGTQEYMAMEKLGQLAATGQWDLVVVDTPPSRHAIDLLEAPERLVKFLGHPVYRTLTTGQRALARITDAAASVFLWAVRRLAGPQLVQDVLAFFRSLSHIEGGLRKRAAEAAVMLRSDRTTFVVVASPRAEAVGEATHLVEALRSRGFPFGGVVANLVHPTPEPFEALSAAEAAMLADIDDGPLADHVRWHRTMTVLAASERQELDVLRSVAAGVPLVELPLLDVDVHDVAGLAVLAGLLVAPG